MININTNPAIPALPKVEDRKNIDVRYLLLPPYASVHIYWDEKLGELIYEVEEPVLNDSEKKDLDELKEFLDNNL